MPSTQLISERVSRQVMSPAKPFLPTVSFPLIRLANCKEHRAAIFALALALWAVLRSFCLLSTY